MCSSAQNMLWIIVIILFVMQIFSMRYSASHSAASAGEKHFSVSLLDGNYQPKRNIIINMDRIEGNWKQLKGNVKHQWGRLIDNQFIAMEGKRDSMAGINQESFGIAREQAPKRLAEWNAFQNRK